MLKILITVPRSTEHVLRQKRRLRVVPLPHPTKIKKMGLEMKLPTSEDLSSTAQTVTRTLRLTELSPWFRNLPPSRRRLLLKSLVGAKFELNGFRGAQVESEIVDEP